METVFNKEFILEVFIGRYRMAKRSKEQVEKDEKTVIIKLQSKAKESIDDLAEECGFSGPKLRRIINNLEEKGIIWGYHAVTDFDKIGLSEYVLLIKKTNIPLDKLAEKIINRDIEKFAEKMDIIIGSSNYLHGLYDWILCFAAEDLRQAKKFDSEFLKYFKEYVQETQLLENIFPVKRSGIENPRLKDLKDFI
ncbi:transcriptional regulator [Thermoplasmatales archaeon ex4572_165]|nr:MAG: transcriptional regulator [Thermoplasmatales archaeon ex4572_165]RLF59007.1 MAG: Lrp/AsnC family transcriptional regulator [Thermoplasmata archaeon]